MNNRGIKLYKMKLGDVEIVEDQNLFTTALRVPGGWVFRSYDKQSKILGSVFVPWDNEFQEEAEK